MAANGRRQDARQQVEPGTARRIRRPQGLQFMAPEVVVRTGGSKCVQAQPAGSKWQSALPTGSRCVQAQPAVIAGRLAAATD